MQSRAASLHSNFKSSTASWYGARAVTQRLPAWTSETDRCSRRARDGLMKRMTMTMMMNMAMMTLQQQQQQQQQQQLLLLLLLLLLMMMVPMAMVKGQ